MIQRARTFGTIRHPNLQPVLDAGVYNGQAYAVLDQPVDSTDLGSLLKEVGGATPGFLAAEYGWAVASALRAIHERGGWHGEVRSGLLLVGPVVTKTKDDGTTRRRPAPNATVKLTETGLVPRQLPAAVSPPGPDVLPYLPPERMDGTVYDPRGDIYGLGASMYLLLAGRPPFTGETAEEVLHKVRSVEPVSLASLRPTEAPELTALVMKMLSKRPENRPQTAAEVCVALAPFCRPGTLSPAAQASAVPTAIPVSVVPQAVQVATSVSVPEAPVDVELEPEAPPEPDAWGVHPNAFADAQAASAADTRQPRRRQLTAADKTKSRIWIAVGLCLHLTAVGLIIAYLLGAFESSPEPATNPDTPPKKLDTTPSKNKTKNKKTTPEHDQ